MKNFVIKANRPHQEFHGVADCLIVVNDVYGRILSGLCIHCSGGTHESWIALFTTSEGRRVVQFMPHGVLAIIASKIKCTR